MCGITGFWQQSNVDKQVAEHMASKIESRGPDDFGVWHSENAGLVVAHRRLSIIDLSRAGHQPMESECGRYVVVFNGEIYNHRYLRTEIENASSHSWRGHSDTETLLACIACWGLQTTLAKLIGMFAFALWDKELRELILVRDRMGEKPLYWGWSHDILLFGSELKAIAAHPMFKRVIDRNALTLLLRHCYIPAPFSIYEGIQKLPPGNYIKIPLKGDVDQSKAAEPRPYWSLNTIVEKGVTAPFSGDDESAIDLLEKTLSESVSGQMLADVPLGAFLSGGVDSSTIAALMQSQSHKPVKTFTIGFSEGGYNEAHSAKLIAQHIGTEHTELYVSSQDALNVIPELPNIYCEPFADSSQIPTFLVNQMARSHVTVALSGDGGDELFGGYNRYIAANKVWAPVQKMPKLVRTTASAGLRALSPATWDRLFNAIRPILPKKARVSIPGEKARKLADVLAVDSEHEFYRLLTSHWSAPENIVKNSVEPETIFTTTEKWPETDCFEHAMMAIDAQTYMPDDVLVKVDRAAMANSLETRVPMLDHRVVELAWKLPLEYKIRNGQGKWLLRQVLYRHVPKTLIERPKMGFAIPLDSWLRGPLRDWAEELLDYQRLHVEGYFHPEPIRKMWLEHLSGKYNWQYHLWNVLMFQAWLEKNRAG